MDRIAALRRSFAHDDWANHEVLRALERARTPPASCLSWLAHVVGAELLWLARLHARPSPLAVWPELTLSELGQRLAELRSSWPRFLAGLDARALEREIAYTNTKGEPWTSRVEDVLEHVLLHGAHHRGQIASALRAAGIDPPSTDYIHAVRTGLLE